MWLATVYTRHQPVEMCRIPFRLRLFFTFDVSSGRVRDGDGDAGVDC